jgi:hypothetical protein
MTTMMLDSIGSTADNIPTATRKVAGYVTGTGGVVWSALEWTRFAKSGRVRIDQSPGAVDPLGSDVLDVEAGASPPAAAVDWLKARIANSMPVGAVYGSGGALAAVEAAFKARGVSPANHLYVWLADWNLNQAQATALLGTIKYGMEVAAVQWASPTSNPNTIMPGGTMTLKQANVDLSVTLDTFFPPPIVPPPPPPPPIILTASLVASPGRVITSHDGGKTWA